MYYCIRIALFVAPGSCLVRIQPTDTGSLVCDPLDAENKRPLNNLSPMAATSLENATVPTLR